MNLYEESYKIYWESLKKVWINEYIGYVMGLEGWIL